MFKKPNRNFRLKKAESDDEADQEEKKALEESKVDNAARNEEKLKAKILSFKDEIVIGDGDDDGSNEGVDEGGGEFKVKKSRESRRIAKEMKKLRREKERQQQSGAETSRSDFNVPEPVVFNKSASTVTKPEVVGESKKEKGKYLVNKYGDELESGEPDNDNDNEPDEEPIDEEDGEDHDEKLRRLREEIEIMNGDELIPVENETDEEKRSMKLMIMSGMIPDASMIHAARKKREMARLDGDYIPLNRSENTVKYKNEKSRFIREDDEGDLSDYEEENRRNGASGAAESRLSMNYRVKEENERQALRNTFLAFEQGSDEEKNNSDADRGRDMGDEDDEEDEWEKEQLRKVLPTNVDLRKSGKTNTAVLRNLISADNSNTLESTRTTRYDSSQSQALSKVDLIKKSINTLMESVKIHEAENSRNEERHKANEVDYHNLKVLKPALDKQYVYFQEIKGFLRDFIDCYNEKITEIEKCESKWLALFKQRADKLTSRRQEDMRDQTNECSTGKPMDPAHMRRMNDRETRRAKRRESREEKLKNCPDEILLNEGLSSDEDETPTDENMFKQKRDDILKQLNESVLEDVSEDFVDVSLVMERFKRWKEVSPSTYSNAYVALSLPKLLSPLVRIDLIDWNPLECDNGGYLETRKWFLELVKFSRDLAHDDLLIIPHLAEKTLLLKLISIAESVYDPFSARQTLNFASLVSKFVNDFPTVNNQSPNTKKLVEAVFNRFKQSIGQDVFVPLYSRQIIEQKSSDKSKFFYRQFWSCVKLYTNVLTWRGIFSDTALRELALDCLFNRYLMISLQNLPLNMKTIRVVEYITQQLPREWLETSSLPQLASTCRLVRKIADTIHDDEFKAKKIDSNRFKEQIREIKNLMSRMGAPDQAILLSNVYEFL